ncbi:DUF3291 domain-containing protein [Marinobacter sp. CHS3-4]|nr:DUF3291 domain-containing protein [Marinobacter sp. CHS3-4]MDI9246296.1 DUF3291 domain-containing protein [Marinobacter sp. CHS3-4]
MLPAGHIPPIEEAAQTLNILRERGSTADAFTFKTAFPAPIYGQVSEN